MREFDLTDDATSMVNDDFVWGGSALGSAGIVFSRTTNSDSVIAHNLWQYTAGLSGDIKDPGQALALSQKIVYGSTEAGTGPESGYGLSRVQSLVSCTWFAHDVPLIDGAPQHIKPGHIVPMSIYTYGVDDETPLLLNLPLRSASISFPSLKPDGSPYVKFAGQFGLQLSDPHWLWTFLLKLKTKPSVPPVATTDNTSITTSYGAYGSFNFPTITDGQTLFTLPFPYIPGTVQFYLNGLLQFLGINYYETSPTSGTVTFSEGLLSTDDVLIECRMLAA
jgi:hypothetical protein